VTAILNPEGLGDADVRKVLQETYHVLVQGGQGALKGKIFRIGHMGIANWADLLVAFAGLERIVLRTGRLARAGPALQAIVERMP
jgi:serine---pyruvate transaminase